MGLFNRAPKPNMSTHPSRGINTQQQQPLAVDLAKGGNPKFVNGVYYPSWRIYRQQPPSSMNLAHVTHVFYAFARYDS